LTVFAALALLVTVAGITGVIATSVSQRTREFGVRMALGASRRTVLGMVVGEGLLIVGAGLAIGGVAAAAASRVLASFLFDTKPTDPVAFAGVAVAFTLAGIAACLGPAWRATTVDPMNALRAE
jgi:putative ABC transport system permease protein